MKRFKIVQLLTQMLPSNLEVHFTSAISWPARNINTDVYSLRQHITVLGLVGPRQTCAYTRQIRTRLVLSRTVLGLVGPHLGIKNSFQEKWYFSKTMCTHSKVATPFFFKLLSFTTRLHPPTKIPVLNDQLSQVQNCKHVVIQVALFHTAWCKKYISHFIERNTLNDINYCFPSFLTIRQKS